MSRDSIIIVMDGGLNIKGKKFISASQAAKITGYASDYVGQLSRAKKIDAQRIGRGWYVSEEDILNHKKNNHQDSNVHFRQKSKKSKNFTKKSVMLDRIETRFVEDGAKDEPAVLEAIKSRTPEIISGIKYELELEPLLPVLNRGFDLASLRSVALETVSDNIRKTTNKKRSRFEQFIIGT